MSKTILIATNNQGKAKEFKNMLEPRGFEVKTLADFPDLPEVEETGNTFEENALLKANALFDITNEIVMADDSGLMVDALNGEPGIHSARYSGKDHDDVANYEKLLKNLEGMPKEERTAHFHTVLVVVGPDREPLIVHGQLDGYILKEPVGENGFGYDPVFYVEELGKSTAQISVETKNKISHRGQALKQLDAQFDRWMGE